MKGTYGTDRTDGVPGTLVMANRFTVAGDGWIQLSPVGEFAHGSGVVQVVDAGALRGLVEGFAEDVLLDFDHESSDPNKRTTAAGWIVEVESREDGLWGRVRWSAVGQQALENGEYRYVSPVWEVMSLGGDRVRPVRLLEAGLTNKPNLKGMRAIANRGETFGAGAPETKKKEMMKLINRALDLTPEASEEAAVAKVEALKSDAAKATELKNRVEALTQERDALLGAQVEADLEKYKNRLSAESLPKWKDALLANRAETLVLLEGIPSPIAYAKTKQPLTNRKPEGSPQGWPHGGGGDTRTLRNRAVQEFQAANKCDFEAAWNAVRAAKPELFKEEA